MTQLNAPQKRCIDIIDHPLLVLAGAGSGKTTVITRKIAHLVAHAGLSAKNIYAVTFTNKAAREMKERCARQLKKSAASELKVGTFHNLGLSIIRREHKQLAIKPGFSIFDAHDSRSLIYELLHERRQSTEDSSAKEAAGHAQYRISGWKNSLTTADQALQQATTEAERQHAEIYGQYERHLRACNAVDFDDLILLPCQLFANETRVLDNWQNRVRYLLVDEYQDTNACQYLLVKQLVGVRRAFTVVGDDDQSIYAWRGAVPENLVTLQRDFPNLEVIKLEQNYRSSGRILKAANQVIANNDHAIEKKLWSKLGFGDALRVLQCENEDAEAQRIATEIVSQRLRTRTDYKDYAVLYRSNHQPQLLEMKLQQLQVPYTISGGSSFFDKAEIKDMLGYLRLIANPQDDSAFLRVINIPRRQIGPSTLEALGHYATQRQISLCAACAELGLEQHLKPHLLEKLRRFSHWLDSIRVRFDNQGIDSAFREMVDELGYEDWLLQNSSSPQVADRRMANIRFLSDSLLNSLSEEQREDTGSQLASALTRLMLQDIAERQQDDEENNQIQLMTLHAAKGLEFAHLFIMGLEEEILPHRNSIEPEAIDEERRLFYVGITRAQKTLTLTLASRRKQYGESVACTPSRFLAELPEEDVEWQGGEKSCRSAQRERGKSALAGLKGLMD